MVLVSTLNRLPDKGVQLNERMPEPSEAEADAYVTTGSRRRSVASVV